jgi:hypothetical protein
MAEIRRYSVTPQLSKFFFPPWFFSCLPFTTSGVFFNLCVLVLSTSFFFSISKAFCPLLRFKHKSLLLKVSFVKLCRVLFSLYVFLDSWTFFTLSGSFMFLCSPGCNILLVALNFLYLFHLKILLIDFCTRHVLILFFHYARLSRTWDISGYSFYNSTVWSLIVVLD